MKGEGGIGEMEKKGLKLLGFLLKERRGKGREGLGDGRPC